jgi:hypothetical protein
LLSIARLNKVRLRARRSTLESDPDRPHVLRHQRAFLSNKAPFVRTFEQHAVSQKQRRIRICPPGTFRSRSTKGRSRISSISGPAGCPPARPDCANCRQPANLTNHRVRTSQSSSLSDGSCPKPDRQADLILRDYRGHS